MCFCLMTAVKLCGHRAGGTSSTSLVSKRRCFW
uniref:Uncharacterized protein n=1 Tax=Anguilla anguilla TaxID=7936 RepID=A0A0E9VS36_ANGAN